MRRVYLLTIILVISFIYATIYIVVQQAYRQGGNDPQIQLAEDAAQMLNRGESPGTLLPQNVDPSQSLAPFLILYDNDGHLITSGATLAGTSLVLPQGVLDHTTASHQSRVTWEPRNGVRIAAVVVKAQPGYVLAGRSLKEVERREDALTQAVALAWIVTLALTIISIIGLRRHLQQR